ncbi:MAG: selenide, water dikinase SelD, partial [Gemmatimonadales bacterium]|nr:selenide, water dikinase SelD [Gemmatimonadales bacterium]
MLRHNVLVDASTRDDAAVYRLSPDRALVATTDFFTPIVDDAATWGAIAAANALSDVYAMGATPLFGLNLVGWPRETLPLELLGEVLRGAAEICARARCPVLGGHTIDDPEPKFGMAVIGEAHPDRLLVNSAARPGDLLVLTKPLGTGILATALKRDAIDEAGLAAAVASMTTLNDGAMRAALACGVRAATDITGFGLLGHGSEMALASGCGLRIRAEAVPLLPGALGYAEAGLFAGGLGRNRQYLEGLAREGRLGLRVAPGVPAPLFALLADSETSGGLLF